MPLLLHLCCQQPEYKAALWAHLLGCYQATTLSLAYARLWSCIHLQFRRNEQEAATSHAGGPPGTTIGGGANVRSRFSLREPNHRQDQNQIASAIQASMDSANAEAAHRDARQHALAQVCPTCHFAHQLTACASPCVRHTA